MIGYSKEYKFEDNIGWMKFNFKTKTWWYYTNDGIPCDLKCFDKNQAIYKVQITKAVVANIDGYDNLGQQTESSQVDNSELDIPKAQIISASVVENENFQ